MCVSCNLLFKNRQNAKYCVLPSKNFRGSFHEIGIVKVLLMPEARSVAQFRECGRDITAGEKQERR